MIDTYSAALAFIHGRTQFKKAPTLSRMHQFLHELGDPQLKVAGIHVAGTNGKGSTVANLRELFMADGLTVGTFTSPFIVRFNERISVDGTPSAMKNLLVWCNRFNRSLPSLTRHWQVGAPQNLRSLPQ